MLVTTHVSQCVKFEVDPGTAGLWPCMMNIQTCIRLHTHTHTQKRKYTSDDLLTENLVVEIWEQTETVSESDSGLAKQ